MGLGAERALVALEKNSSAVEASKSNPGNPEEEPGALPPKNDRRISSGENPPPVGPPANGLLPPAKGLLPAKPPVPIIFQMIR